MAIQNRLYRRFLLLLLFAGSLSIFNLVYFETKKSETLKKNYDMVRHVDLFQDISFDVPAVNHSRKPRTVKSDLNDTDITRNKTKETSFPVTLYAPYLIENPTLCSSVQNLSIVVIVHTAPGHLEQRNTIRATWTNETYFRHLGRVRVLFLLGRVMDENTQQNIRKEFAQFGDLLQGDFIDAYKNLSHKGVMAYKWLTERCRNAKFVLKVDDDVVINTYEMLTMYLQKFERKSKQIFCNHNLPGTMLIIRQKNSKWYVDESEFKGRFYPPYCSGFTVLFTNDVIPELYRASAITPFFWVDDVYLYGLVPAKVPGITYNRFKHGDAKLGKKALECYTNITRICNYIAIGDIESWVVNEIWAFMTKSYTNKVMVSRSQISFKLSNPLINSAKNTNGSSI